MAIAIRDQGTPDIQYSNGGEVSSFVVNKPTGLAADDIILIDVYLYNGTVARTVSTAPSGFTLIDSWSFNPSGAFYNIYRYWYRATGSDPASWTWTLSGGAFYGVQQGTFSGCETSGSPIDDFDHLITTTANNGVTVPSVDVTSNGSLLVYISNNNNGRTYTPPSDGLTWRERHEDSGTNNYWADAIVNAGATGTKKFTLNSNDEHSGDLIVIKVAGGGGGGAVVKDFISLGFIPFAR